MKTTTPTALFILTFFVLPTFAEDFNAQKFTQDYFAAWTATQSPEATKKDI